MDSLTVDQLAEVLQESKVPLMRQVLRVLGPDRTTAVLADALQCEANGGMLVAAEKASILRVKVPSCQLPDSGT